MIDHGTEQLITLREAARLLPRRKGKSVNVSTVWRWAFRGVKGVRLEVIRIGGRWYTTDEALQRFIDALPSQGDATPPAPTPSRRQRQIEKTHRRVKEVLKPGRMPKRSRGGR